MAAAAAAMIGLGFMVQNMRKPDYVEEDVEDSIYEAVQMSGVGGWPLDVLQKLSDSFGTQLGLGYLGIDPKPWADGVDLSRMSPITSQMLALPMAAFNPESEGDDYARAIRYMIPWNNHIAWSTVWDLPDTMRKHVGDTMDMALGN